MTRVPVSAFIIAKNEADRIGRAIASVRDWADEVVVVDSGSTDDTVALGHAAGARVEFHEWAGYGPQKVFAEALCRNHWVLNLDADEEVTPALAAEIAELFAAGSPPAPAYAVEIRMVMRFSRRAGRLNPRTVAPRLYDRRRAGFRPSTVHDYVIPRQGETARFGRLRGIMLHRCFRSYRHAVAKINDYTTLQAEDMVRRGRRPSALRLAAEPLLALLKALVIKRYGLLGVEGWVESVIYAFARTLRLAKARELWLEREAER